MEIEERERAIASSELAKGLSPAFVRKLAEIAQWRKIPRGGRIVEEFDESFDLLLLVSGEGRVMTVTDEMITTIRPGMPIGEISFFDRRPRAAGVVAVEDSLVLTFPEHDLRALTRAEPGQAILALNNLARVLCGRLRRANQQIAALLAVEESREI
ncbi:MAG: hypothetical protein C4320_02805 [Armatimonadota bacterium]